jgi:8-hydroxy-5-deazaflavin:NADPH oxidoreductase
MKYAVLGTGSAGRTIAARLAELGHEVTVGTRDPEATRARDEYADWAATRPDVGLATYADASSTADVVVNATNGAAAVPVLGLAGADNLAGKVVIDVSNPLDYSRGMPPSLFVKDTDSLVEQIQRAFPEARLVKTLNTMNAEVMTHPDVLSDRGSVFVSGDDTDAKATASAMLAEFGHTDVIDLGDLSTARGAEMLLPIWVQLMRQLGTARFNFKIVR